MTARPACIFGRNDLLSMVFDPKIDLNGFRRGIVSVYNIVTRYACPRLDGTAASPESFVTTKPRWSMPPCAKRAPPALITWNHCRFGAGSPRPAGK